jgi:murein DD-endopeptidase MepM/ murein hydrolase activator NlpD
VKRIAFIGLLIVLGAVSVSLALAQGIEDLTPQPTQGTPIPLATATPLPKPAPFSVAQASGMVVSLYFSEIAQGQVGLVQVQGAGISGVRARFLNETIEFFPVAGDGFYGLLSVNMEQSPRVYDLSIFATFADDSRASLTIPITVTLGRFIRQDNITIAPDRAYLVDSEIERNELARMESIFSAMTPERLWDDHSFQMPILGSNLTSPFGAFRTFNGTHITRHTGWDIRSIMGMPVMASAAGEVAFAGRLDIRGNIVVINHGYGVFSTYSHLSQVHVTRGQTVVKGQIIGVTGDTGRSSGPHFHWEIAVNGVFVDSVQFTETWLP